MLKELKEDTVRVFPQIENINKRTEIIFLMEILIFTEK